MNRVGLLALSFALLAGCADAPEGGTPASTSPGRSGVIDTGDGGIYRPRLDPAQFVKVIDNRYFPLTPGARWVYEGRVDGEATRIELQVTTERRTILGISAVGVRDVNYTDGEPSAVTTDWYAQDRSGNVWYLGENTQNYENGKPAGTEGWQAGVDGAQPGIFMLARPEAGTAYRQAYRRGEVEDSAEVLRVGGTFGGYRDVIVVRGWSRLDPTVVEEKTYAPGVGKIHETLTAGGNGGTRLVRFTPPHQAVKRRTIRPWWGRVGVRHGHRRSCGSAGRRTACGSRTRGTVRGHR